MPRCRLVAALLTLGLCVPAGAQAADCAGADLVPAADNAAVVSQATLCLLNQQRAAAGAAALTENGRLTRASAAYSRRMVTEAFFDHEAPDGATLVTASREPATTSAPRPSSARTSDGARARSQPRARWSRRGWRARGTARTC